VTVAIAFAEKELVCASKWEASVLAENLRTDELLVRSSSMKEVASAQSSMVFSTKSSSGYDLGTLMNAQAVAKAARKIGSSLWVGVFFFFF
jgi:hypothetical protein